MKTISKNVIEKYNLHRIAADKTVLCHAPFTSINFAQNGNMTACCFNRAHVLGKYPHQSIQQAWYGKSADELRNYIRNNDLGGGCKLCQLALESENFSGSKAIFYDTYGDTPVLQKPQNFLRKLFGNVNEKVSAPKVFEFELDNTCNLECIMCDGYFSSTIRANREHLPAIKNPYDDAFVEQVAEFLPGITDLKFLGGEPFLIEVYLKIWEKVLAINPKIKIHITTNGTVMNARVKELLEKLNCGIVVSIDSLDKDTYSSIRKRGNLDKVLENIQYFKQLTQKKNTYLSIAVCPMRNNWREMPALVNFANQMSISIHFNIVWNPEDVSLRFESPAVLEEVVQVYSVFKPDTDTNRKQANFESFTALLHQIKYWLEDRKNNWPAKLHYAALASDIKLNEIKGLDDITRQTITYLLLQMNLSGEIQLKAKQQMIDLSASVPPQQFIASYFKGIQFILNTSGAAPQNMGARFTKIESTALQLSDKATFVSDVVRNGTEGQIGYFLYEDIDLLTETITARYSMATAI